MTKHDQIVKHVMSLRGTCPHQSYIDCGRCLAKWIRAALRKYGVKP